jgi:RNA polymerase sigma-70 factor (ECF subfamily)
MPSSGKLLPVAGDIWVTATRALERPYMTEDSPPADPAGHFDEVFNAYFADIHRYAARRLGPDTAADVAAQAFLEAFRQRRRYDPARASVRTWLYGFATNVIGRQRRTEARALAALARLNPDRDPDGHADRVESRVSAEGLRGELATVIAALPPGQRDVLLLVALADLSHEEVAAALGISYGTVGSRLNRARTTLRKALGGINPILVLEEHRG